jgi:mono/diheme cytochrome c family protein
MPGRSIEVLVDLARVVDGADVAVGDRVPVEKAELEARVLREGTRDVVAYRVQPVSELGTFGVHAFAPVAGVYRIALRGTADGNAVALDLRVAVGLPPQEAEKPGDGSARMPTLRGARRVLKTGDAGGADVLVAMRALTQRWLDLDAALAALDRAPQKSQQALVERTSTAWERLQSEAERASELRPVGIPAGGGYASRANAFVAALRQVGEAKARSPAIQRAALRAIELEQCAGCHAQYSWKMLTAAPTAISAPAPGPAPMAIAASTAIQAGEPHNGAALYRVECAACHGSELRGDGYLRKDIAAAPENLRNAGLMLALTDSAIAKEIAEGITSMADVPLMPGFARGLSPLDIADVVAYLRARQISIPELFAGAGRYTAVRYEVDEVGQQRYQRATGKALDSPRITVFTGYRGGDTAAPSLIADSDNLALAALKKAD